MKRVIPFIALIVLICAIITGCATKDASLVEEDTPLQVTEEPLEPSGPPESPEPSDSPEENPYQEAMVLFDSLKYREALTLFSALGDYKDSAIMVEKINDIYAQKYADAKELFSEGEFARAALAFGRIPDYKDSFELSRDLFQQLKNNIAMAVSGSLVYAIKDDGTLYYSGIDFRLGQEYPHGNKPNHVDGWKNIVEISGGPMQILGVTEDGRVIPTGVNYILPRTLSLHERWTEVDTVYAGSAEQVIGLSKDGSVLHSCWEESNSSVLQWEDIVAVAAGDSCVYGLRNDGTVVSFIGSDPNGPADSNRDIDVSGWTDIVAIEAAYDHIIGLKSDGTIVVAGPFSETIKNNHESELAYFTDIVAISGDIASDKLYNIVGLKSDGTVVVLCRNRLGEGAVNNWTSIVAVRACHGLTIGLRYDGTVLAVGDNGFGQCDAVESWKNVAVVPLKGRK